MMLVKEEAHSFFFGYSKVPLVIGEFLFTIYVFIRKFSRGFYFCKNFGDAKFLENNILATW